MHDIQFNHVQMNQLSVSEWSNSYFAVSLRLNVECPEVEIGQIL